MTSYFISAFFVSCHYISSCAFLVCSVDYERTKIRYWRRVGMSSGGTLGHIEEFDGAKGDWPLYVERLEHFFAVSEDGDKRRAVLLSVMGAATYKILRNVVSPSKPGGKTYATLVEALSQHFKPKPSEIVEHFKFHSRVCKPGESVATYVAELSSLSEYCNFGDTLEVMIRDRLV